MLNAKDAETEKRLAVQEIASLTQQITKQQEQIADLKEQLDQAHQRVAEAMWRDCIKGPAAAQRLRDLIQPAV